VYPVHFSRDRAPLPKELEETGAASFGERAHWTLWQIPRELLCFFHPMKRRSMEELDEMIPV
jgi:hypothetical protein